MPPNEPPSAWSLARLVDLECAFFRVERGHLRRLPEGWSPPEGGRPARLARWLTVHQEAHPDTFWPGEPAEDLLNRLGLLATGLCGLSGALLALGLIAYEGDAPANITLVWAGLVGLQLLWLVSLLLFQGLRRLGRRDAARLPGSFAFEALGGLWRWLLLRRARMEGKPASADDLAAFWPWFRRRWSLHRRTLVRALLARLHAAGVAFNLGALVALMVALAVTDRAFGWESTLVREPATMHRLVEAVALPWSAWLPEAVPGLETVRGSRFVVQQGIEPLDARALAAWWPFILMSVAVYGLLPRMLLALVTGWLARRLTRHPPLDHADCLRLDASLGVAEQLFRPEPSDDPARGSGTAARGAGESSPTDGLSGLLEGRVTALADPDWLADQEATVLARVLVAATGTDAVTVRAHGSGAGDGEPAAIRLQEAWQPPVREQIEVLRNWEASVAGPPLLLLTGRPDPDREALPGLTAPEGPDLAVWRARVADAGLHRIVVEPWNPQTVPTE